MRGAVLRVSSAGRKAHTLKRPLQRLYPLELPSPSLEGRVEEPIHKTGTEEQAVEGESGTVERSSRPMRTAAKKARDNIKAITFYEQDSD